MPNARADEDLTRLGFIAKARGDIGNGPNGGVIKAPLDDESLGDYPKAVGPLARVLIKLEAN